MNFQPKFSKCEVLLSRYPLKFSLFDANRILSTCHIQIAMREFLGKRPKTDLQVSMYQAQTSMAGGR